MKVFKFSESGQTLVGIVEKLSPNLQTVRKAICTLSFIGKQFTNDREKVLYKYMQFQ